MKTYSIKFDYSILIISSLFSIIKLLKFYDAPILFYNAWYMSRILSFIFTIILIYWIYIIELFIYFIELNFIEWNYIFYSLC